ncbi:Uma2 family endonuclease [Catalinimonas sp. 4WD22]|uniref:Uma2 family endonuclease n=1 Tax=Catalinimonas locisalis TaxID=3133978 RepID=UPI0031015397
METQATETLTEVHKLKYTAGDIEKLYKAGILHEDDRIELVEGEIFYMSPINFPHAQCVNKLTDIFNQQLRDTHFVNAQNPLRLDHQSIVQPDLAIFERGAFFSLTDHPTSNMVKLLIEVANSSYQADRKIKLPKYAEGGITEVWIVNLQEHAIEVFTQPRDKQYLSQQTYLSDQSVPTPFQFSIAVQDILPSN